MTTSVKNIESNLHNMGTYLINTNNYDDNNYDETSDAYKSILHGNDFNKYQTSLKSKATYITEGFNGHNTLTNASQSVLLKTQMSSEQQAELTRLKQELVTTQASYNSILNTISPATDNSAKLRQLAQLGSTLDVLSKQINTINDVLKTNVTSVNDQISKNSSESGKYMNDISSNDDEEDNMLNISNNIQNMLNDSEIATLQKNYSYILLSILAAASILVAMNVIKTD